ncbi:MAG: GerMN domain-containing protein, partial [Eisenbergiella sp.]
TVKDGICYVNVDENFMTQIYNVTADVVIYSIVNSLVELSNVNKVQIAVNGKTDIVFRETFNLVNLYERNLELIKTGENQK